MEKFVAVLMMFLMCLLPVCADNSKRSPEHPTFKEDMAKFRKESWEQKVKSAQEAYGLPGAIETAAVLKENAKRNLLAARTKEKELVEKKKETQKYKKATHTDIPGRIQTSVANKKWLAYDFSPEMAAVRDSRFKNDYAAHWWDVAQQSGDVEDRRIAEQAQWDAKKAGINVDVKVLEMVHRDARRDPRNVQKQVKERELETFLAQKYNNPDFLRPKRIGKWNWPPPKGLR